MLTIIPPLGNITVTSSLAVGLRCLPKQTTEIQTFQVTQSCQVK